MDSAEEGAVESRPSVLDRYSPVKVSVLLHLPESNARSFLIASALGAILDRDGTRNSLKSAKDATGVVISVKRGNLIRRELGIGPRHWRRLVNDWERRQIAHRCSPGIVVLFTTPFLPECPACHKPVEVQQAEVPSVKSKSRGRPFEVKRTHHVRETDVSRPRGGADMSTGAAQTRPFLGTDSEHPKSGVAIRAEEGTEAVQPSEVPLEVSSEGSSEGSKKRRGRDPKAWPVPEDGYVSAWDIDFDGKAGR